MDFFDPTIWTTILRARDGQEDEAVAALGIMLERYYAPIVRHLQNERRCGQELATELTHDFLVHCQGREFLKAVDPEKGKFRCFIKRSIRNFLRDRHDATMTRKRGEGIQPASLDERDGEGRPLHEPTAAPVDPGLDLDRAWAQTIWTRCLAQLRRECEEALRSRMFNCLVGSLGLSDHQVPLSELAKELGTTEGAVKVARHRLRRRLRELLELEVRQTVATDKDWHEELPYIIRLLTSR